MYDFLHELSVRPPVHSCSTTEELWTDPHTSEQMLAYHLDPSIDLSSRSPEFMDRSVRWMLETLPLPSGARVLDLGCGPGLYAGRLARAGLDVTGVDFSERSLGYAREQAAEEGLEIDYRLGDYLEAPLPPEIDLAQMIFCDYSALGPGDRGKLLERVREVLAPGGHFLLDVMAHAGFSPEESVEYGRDLLGGFWAPSPYYGFRHRFTYPDERVALDRYTILEPGRTRQFLNWIQYFDRESLGSELESHGLEIVGTWSDVAGTPFEEDAEQFAVLARVRGGD